MSFLAPLVLYFEPVGKWFELRESHVTSPSHRPPDVDTEDEDSSDEEEEEHVNPLLLDPTQWRVCSVGVVSRAVHILEQKRS